MSDVRNTRRSIKQTIDNISYLVCPYNHKYMKHKNINHSHNSFIKSRECINFLQFYIRMHFI